MPKKKPQLQKKIRKQNKRFIFNYWDWCCAYCGRRTKFLTFDHIIPRSSGGSNRIKNLVPACHTCNLEKGKMNVELFAAPEKLKEIYRYMTLSKYFTNTYNLLYKWYSHPNWHRWEK
jgi:5-methylcytosine-specific restriction endonuclease McrA